MMRKLDKIAFLQILAVFGTREHFDCERVSETRPFVYLRNHVFRNH